MGCVLYSCTFMYGSTFTFVINKMIIVKFR